MTRQEIGDAEHGEDPVEPRPDTGETELRPVGSADPAGLEERSHTGGVAETEGRDIEIQVLRVVPHGPADGGQQKRCRRDVELAFQ
nr:hypothetical protein [Streptomyces sp. 1114.5]